GRTSFRIARERGRKAPIEADRKEAEARVKAEAVAGVPARATERAEAINHLLSSTPGALLLARALGEDRIPRSLRLQVLKAAIASSDVQVRDLFERFVPDDQRTKRLGSAIKPEQILALKGDV